MGSNKTMEPIKMTAGTSVLIGAPAQPVPQAISGALRNLVESLPGVAEAHLPQCFVPGVMLQPAQVLIVALRNGTEEETMRAIGQALPTILPPGMPLDVWPLVAGHELLRHARSVGCELKAPGKSHRWWPFAKRGTV